VLALIDRRNDLMVSSLSDEQRIKELNEQLSSMDSASAPRITIKSKEIALIEPDGKAEFDETWTK
jgi:hypothetical protein